MRKGANRPSLHLVDAENLAGGAYPAPGAVESALADFVRLSGHRAGDLVFVAANRRIVRRIAFGAPFSWIIRLARGRDGADRALVGDAPPEWVCGRFGRLVIGSGDHAFLPLATAARAAELEVIVIGRRGSVSTRYRLLGCEIRYLPDQHDAVADDLSGEAA